MLRLFSLVGMAVLAATAVALTCPASKVERRQPRPTPDNSDDSPRRPAALPAANRPRLLYYASFSVN